MGNSLIRWEWNEVREKAAVLLAENMLTYDEIAEKIGCQRQSLHNWKKCPEFAARIEEISREVGTAAVRHAIAKKNRRLASITKRWEKLHQIIEERAADPEMQKVPGGSTGLLVRQLKSIGVGKASQVIEEYVVDTGLLREISNLEKQAVEEVGPETEEENVGFDLDARKRALANLIAGAVERGTSGNSGVCISWNGEKSAGDGVGPVQGQPTGDGLPQPCG